jgi:subtilisin family serine protease
MAKEVVDDENARRLHPRLRMLRNGGSEVNGLRSEISATVASTAASTFTRDLISGILHEESGLDAAQEAIRWMNPEAVPAESARLKKRPHLNEVAPSNDAFVNVFVEVRPADSPMARPEDSSSEVPSVLSDLNKSLPADLPLCVGTGGMVRGRQICASVPVAKLAELEQDRRVVFIAPSEPLKLDVPQPFPAGAPTPRKITTAREAHGDGIDVIIGIIDVGGFDFSHPDFLDDQGQTRFIAIWDQGGDFRSAPARFGYGSEFKKQHLDAALAEQANGRFRAVDLERQSQRTPASHGTHVASIAAGGSGVCPKAQIAAVLVDIPAEEDLRERRRQTFSDTSRISHAVEYLLAIAEAAGKPISINISLGTNGGAHDGSSGISRWLDHALVTPGRSICVAAGNAGQEAGMSPDDLGWIMGRIHTGGRVAARGLVVELEWTVVGNGIADISENELEVWYSPQDRFIVQVQPPGGDRWYDAGPGEFRQNKRLPDGTTLSIYNELYHPSNGANYIAIYLSPNLEAENPRGIRAGIWKVRLVGEEIRDGRFHAWIERDDPTEIGRVAGERFFRFPSFFSTLSNVDSHSISSLGCGHNVIAVANLNPAAQRINATSSQGPTRDGRLKPDICAPGTDVRAAKGFRPDDELWVSMSGTSMASPYAAGVIGLMLAANPRLTSAQCLGILQRTSNPLPGTSYDWRDDAGFGAIDPARAISEARTFSNRKELA